MTRASKPILVADVGGTKTFLAVASEIENAIQLANVRPFVSKDFDTFDDLLSVYLPAIGTVPHTAVLGVAGPVLDGQARITNLPWHLDERTIEARFGLDAVRLINDLEAMAWMIPRLTPDDVVVLQKGVRAVCGPMALIAPGTGLGEAFLTWNETTYTVHPTEGGHADYSPCCEEQDQLLAHLREEFEHVSAERVCSGSGLANIYRFLIQRDEEPETPLVQARIEEADDITPIIIAAAMSKESPVCARAVRILVDSLAVEAGNFALKTLATGGVFLGGGLPMRILPLLQSPAFLDRFESKGRFSEFLRRIPVVVLRDPLAPLRGAAIYGVHITSEPDKGRSA